MVKFNTKVNSLTSGRVNKMQMKKLTWVYVVFSVLFSFVGVSFIIGGSVVFGCVFILIFGVGFYPLCKTLTKLMQKNIDKTSSVITNETDLTITFTEEKIIIDSVSPNLFTEHLEAFYNYIYKITESNEEYFIFTNRVNCHHVPKNTLTEGTLEELASYLQNNFPVIKHKGSFIEYLTK